MGAPIVLETANPDVTLRELTPEDDQVYFEAYNASRPEIAVFDPQAATKHVSLEDTIRSREQAGNKLRMGLWDKDTFVASVNATPQGLSTEIGYWTHSRHTGRGYATLGARALSAYVSELSPRVYADVHQDNQASARVLEKAGFAYPEPAKEPDHIMYTFVEGAPSLFIREMIDAVRVPRGEYRVVSGSDTPVAIREGQITYITGERQFGRDPMPGVHSKGFYLSPEGSKSIVSFLYHKELPTGQLEVDERVIILRGIGFGQHPAHGAQPPTWYLVGSQIATVDHETGQPIGLPDHDMDIPVKHFSLACITGGPFGRLVLANS